MAKDEWGGGKSKFKPKEIFIISKSKYSKTIQKFKNNSLAKTANAAVHAQSCRQPSLLAK